MLSNIRSKIHSIEHNQDLFQTFSVSRIVNLELDLLVLFLNLEVF